MSAHAPLSVAATAGLGAALATIVADLHHLGVAHGQIDASHVLLDDEGRPVLCGFGAAEWAPPGGTGAATRRGDVAAIAALLLRQLGPAAPRPLLRCLRRASRPGRRASARWLARALVAAVADAHLPSANLPAGQVTATPRPRRWRLAVAVPLVTVVAVTVAVAVAFGPWPGRGGHPAVVGVAGACPPVDDGCRPLPTPGGVLVIGGNRYSVGTGVVAVLGRWDCGVPALPAVLQLPADSVWVFDTWPTAEMSVPARPVGDFPAARSLAVVPGRTGCDSLRVLRSGQPPVVADTRP